MKVPPPDLARRLLDASEGILGDEPAPRLEDVARTVGASRASMYYYFAGRDDLLAYLLTAHARAGAEFAQARAVVADPPPVRLRAMLEALAEYLGSHPGVCAGMLAATGGGRRMAEVLAVNDTWVAAPLRAVVAEGVASGLLVAGDPDDPAGVTDAVNVALGGLLLGVLGRASSGDDPADAAFRRHLVDQIERGLLGLVD
jgi:AcrR family transcriptional regulator